MKILEITDNPLPIVYLDLDGVLCDFFSEWAKLAGVAINAQNRYDYHDIPAGMHEPTLDKMGGTDFFSRLPKFSTADQLVQLVIQNFGSYSVCSSPLRGDHTNCAYHKKKWIANHLHPPPAEIIITPHKGKYAVQPNGAPNILIDDRGKNIIEWNAAGGIGIKYQADEDSLDVVIRGLANAKEQLKMDSLR